MKKIVAIVIHMGMIRKRSIREYGATNPYLATPIFHSSVINTIAFGISNPFTIIRFLRFADCGNLVPNDRLQRIRPFVDKVRDLCQQKYIPSRNVAVDESLMLFKGRLVCTYPLVGEKHWTWFSRHSNNTILAKELALVSKFLLCATHPTVTCSTSRYTPDKVEIFVPDRALSDQSYCQELIHGRADSLMLDYFQYLNESSFI